MNAQKLKGRLLTSTCDVKRKRLVKYNVIDENVVAFVNLLRNRTNPLPVTLSIVREYAEQVAKNLGEKDFCASSGWWEKVRKRNGNGKSIGLTAQARITQSPVQVSLNTI